MVGRREFRELINRIRGLATFARLLRVDDSGDLQLIQVEGFVGEIREGVPRVGEVGFSSHPLPDSQGVVLALGGDRGRLVMIGTEDRRNRPKDLPEGSAEVYAPGDSEVRARFNSDGSIEVDGAEITVNVSGTLEINGTALEVNGPITITGAVSINGIDFSTHTHISATPGVPTGVPQ